MKNHPSIVCSKPVGIPKFVLGLILLWCVMLGPVFGIRDTVAQTHETNGSSDGTNGSSVGTNVSSTEALYQLSAYEISGSISLDGRLDETEWHDAEVISDFIQFEPIEGEPATQPTSVQVLYGENSLFIGAVLYDSDPDAIEAALGRRDEYNRADWFLVSIDSYFDKKTAYTFGVNAAGVQLDAIRTSGRRGDNDDDGPGGDLSWDAIWYSNQRITHEGWAVEMSIPYSMLRFPGAEIQTWGVHFLRSIPRLGEQSEWPHVPLVDRTNLVARFGHLTGLNNVEPERNIQISPYTVSRLQRNEDPEAPGSVIGTTNMDIGGDLKVGLGTNITLDATINPDFGQVESDPSVLNLTAFETFFQERRPFFLEGMQIYDFDVGPARLPYTRRIGARAPIIGAAKLSGRTEGGLSFGLLGAATGDDFDPTRSYGVARLSQQFGAYSRSGAIVALFNGPGLAGIGNQRSIFAGVDYDLRFVNNTYNLEGFVGLTSLWWTEADPDRETGFGGKFLLRKRQGALTGFAGVEGFGESFYLNDVGQLRQNNYVALPLRLEYNFNNGQPFGPFLRASVGDFGMQQFSVSDGLDLGQRHRFSAQGMLRGFQQVSFGVSFENIFGGYDIYETRGLDPWIKPLMIGFQAQYGTDARRSWQVEPALNLTLVDIGGREYGFGVEGEWNVSSRFAFSGLVEGTWEDDIIAWSSNEVLLDTENGWLIGLESASAPGDFIAFEDQGQLDVLRSRVAPFEGDRYYLSVFGARDTRSIDMTLRGTITFTPNLSLQTYTQLFLARGRYNDHQLLQDRDTLIPFDTFPKRNEFAFSTLTSNVVLRWEYRPGSTVFLVWTHGRRADDVLNPLAPWGRSPYERHISGQIGDTFDIIPTNVFLVKVSYTFL